ncbi:MAG: methylated-DNA--[protein]-cysteine S-methyltransferase [Dethiobacter sp.]|jgi:methylated-DNA-[protein]-cysteine S-methyltransferase|nr:methylated-DNA--[protein]-cysteine S-methyltransferase [Dethiobacter sp.]
MERRLIETCNGPLQISFNQSGLFELNLPGNLRQNGEMPTAVGDPEWVWRLADELKYYFKGLPVSFSCPLDFSGYTPFFRRILLAAAEIPYGERRPYRWLAEQAGSPGAARAAGQAMAANRTPLVIPCHRVVRSDGVIGGFSGGPGWKERLLNLETAGRTYKND